MQISVKRELLRRKEKAIWEMVEGLKKKSNMGNSGRISPNSTNLEEHL